MARETPAASRYTGPAQNTVMPNHRSAGILPAVAPARPIFRSLNKNECGALEKWGFVRRRARTRKVAPAGLMAKFNPCSKPTEVPWSLQSFWRISPESPGSPGRSNNRASTLKGWLQLHRPAAPAQFASGQVGLKCPECSDEPLSPMVKRVGYYPGRLYFRCQNKSQLM